MSVPNPTILATKSMAHGGRVHTCGMSQVRLGMCQDMKTDILELVEEMIFVRRIVRFVMNACSLGHPTRKIPIVSTMYLSMIMSSPCLSRRG